MFFDGWMGIGRVLVVGTLAYVALGSTLATILLSETVALAEGVTALGLLVLLQAVISWLSVRSPRFQALVKSEPTLLLRDGVLLPDAMRRQRVTREEVQAALRSEGMQDPAEAAAVILETDGSISVIAAAPNGPG